MMISPEEFIEEYKNKTYTDLVLVRDGLITDILHFEKNRNILVKEQTVLPSPETIYQMNLSYLAKLFELIADKYGDEFI